MALYGLAFTEAALKSLRKIEPKKVRSQIKNKIMALTDEPRPQGCRIVQGATNGGDPVFRIRSGDYRVLYSVNESPANVVILDVGNRKDIYRRL